MYWSLKIYFYPIHTLGKYKEVATNLLTAPYGRQLIIYSRIDSE